MHDLLLGTDFTCFIVSFRRQNDTLISILTLTLGHNLIHEDHEMMAAVNITALADLGYKETTRFLDPMEARYRAKGFKANAFSARTGVFSNKQIDAKCKFFDELNAYRDMDDVEQALDDYWSAHTRRRRARRAITTADLL